VPNAVQFNVTFYHKYGYIRDKRSGVVSYPYPVKKASNILTSTLTVFLFRSGPKTERDRDAHLNYYTSAYNTKNASLTKKHNTKSTHKKLKPGLVAFYNIRPENEVVLFR